jgi:hypothetical protein
MSRQISACHPPIAKRLDYPAGTATSPNEGSTVAAEASAAPRPQGCETGGHRSRFDPDAPTTSSARWPLPVHNLDRPVIAAGGFWTREVR